MKALLFILILAATIALADTGAVYIKCPTTYIVTVSNRPAVSICIYYGAYQGAYTNFQTWSLRDVKTNSIAGYDAFLCKTANLDKFVVVPIGGLVKGQTFFYGYSLLNDLGQESPIYNNSVCAWTVTNSSISRPTNLRIQ